MITQKTAHEISSVCNEIKDCKIALSILQGKSKPEPPFMNVSRNKEDGGITLSLANNIAKEALDKQLSFLRDKYKDLNDKAGREANI